MRALELFAIYVTPFLIVGAVIKVLMKRYAVDLPDVQKEGGPHRRPGACSFSAGGELKSKAACMGGRFRFREWRAPKLRR